MKFRESFGLRRLGDCVCMRSGSTDAYSPGNEPRTRYLPLAVKSARAALVSLESFPSLCVRDSAGGESAMMKIPGEPDLKPFKLYRADTKGELVNCVAEFETESEMREFKRRPDWHYAFFHGTRRLKG